LQTNGPYRYPFVYDHSFVKRPGAVPKDSIVASLRDEEFEDTGAGTDCNSLDRPPPFHEGRDQP